MTLLCVPAVVTVGLVATLLGINIPRWSWGWTVA